MATTIRLTRMGRKKRPFYRLVVLDSRKRRDGAYLANLGYYNPFAEPHEVQLHEGEIISWLQKGATVSDTARSLLKAEGVMLKYSLIRQGLDEAEVATRMETWRTEAGQRRESAAAAETARREAARTARDQREEEAKAKAKAATEEEAAAAKASEAAAAEEAAPATEDATAEEAAPAAEAEAPAEAASEKTPAAETPAEEANAEDDSK